MAMRRKRSRRYAPRRARRSFKRARPTRSRLARKVVTYGNTDSTTRDITIRGRKSSRRAWVKHLWESTKFLTKYHYATSGTGGLTVPASTVQATWFTVRVFPNGAPTFSTMGGQNVATSIPANQQHVVVRGGRVNLTCYNDSTLHTLRVRVYLVKIVTNTISIVTGTFDAALSPTDPFDFNVNTRVVFAKAFDLGITGSTTVECKLPPHRLEANIWTGGSLRGSYHWIVCASNVTAATVSNMVITNTTDLCVTMPNYG